MPDVVPSWTVVIPAKRGDVAKSRLAPELGPWRVRLARAFALDTITAARSCPSVGHIIVVS
ncbi:MAG: 2-phospho-L-lactate guanylyltransferase, partial [Nocardioidaceae bacterium]